MVGGWAGWSRRTLILIGSRFVGRERELGRLELLLGSVGRLAATPHWSKAGEHVRSAPELIDARIGELGD